MTAASRPIDEIRRLELLLDYRLPETQPQPALDELTQLASQLCSAPIALLSVLDAEHECFAACIGATLTRLPQGRAFGRHVLATGEVLIVADALRDARFAQSPLVTDEPRIRFYAAVPLLANTGQVLGTLAVADIRPRSLEPAQLQALTVLSHQVMCHLELRRYGLGAGDPEARLFREFRSLPVAMAIQRWSTRCFVDVNAAFTRLLGWRAMEAIGRTPAELNIVDESTAAELRAELERTRSVHDMDVPLGTHSGETRNVLLSSRLVELHGELHAIYTCVDITSRKQAEQALRASERRLRNLIDGLGPSMFVGMLTPEGVIVEANRAVLTATGLTAEEVTGRRLDELPPWTYCSDVQGQLRGAIDRAARGEPARYDVRVLAAGDRMIDIDFSLEPVRDETGHIAFLVPSANDITERKQAEVRVQHLNRVYSTLSDINQTIVREKDPQRMLEGACSIAVAQGRFKMAWIGLVDPETGELDVRAHAGASADTLELLRALVRGAQPDCAFTFRALHTSEHGVSNDIATDPLASSWSGEAVKRGYRAMASLPLRCDSRVTGTFNLYAGESGFFNADELRLLDELAADISFALELHERERERQKVQHALSESEQRFRELAETIQEVFWMTDPVTQEVLYVSPGYEKIWGRPRETLRDNPRAWLDAVHPDDRERVRQAANTKQARGDYAETYRIVRPDGTVRWIRARAFPVRGRSAENLRIVGAAQDITEQQQLEDQFRQAQKMEAIGQLAGGVAHDFNNILTVIRGYSSLLLYEEQTPEASEAVRQIVQATDRAAELTRQLLAFGRRQVMQPSLLDLNEIVTTLGAMLRRILGEDISLVLELHPAPLLTRADAGMLDQVLMNLVINARDAMPSGGELCIATTELVLTPEEARELPSANPGRHVCLRVRDTGMGISTKNLPHIFEPFFTTKEPGKGTGLGLATVFGIIAQHGGAVRVSSAPEQGSMFEVLLRSADPAEHVASAHRAARAALGGTETILVVEDDPYVRELTRVVLAQQGYRVLEAAHGPQALLVWEQQRGAIDLLLTDIVMPEGMNGRELAAHLRTLDPALRVVFTTGYSADVAGQELSVRERETFIPKPSTPEQLIEAVRRCLDA